MKSMILFAIAFVVHGATALASSVVISVADESVVAGSSPTISLAVTISGEPTQAFQVGFNITGGTVTQMEFVSQLNPGTGPTLDDPNYVFANDSSDADPNYPSGFGAASRPSGSPYNTIFTAADFTDSGNDITPTNQILANLIITVPAFTSPSGQDIFTVSLDPTASTFFDSSGSAVSIDTADSKLTGSITVNNAVPEPRSLSLLLIAATLLPCARLYSLRTLPFQPVPH